MIQVFHHLIILFPHDDGFSKAGHSYIKKAYCNIFDDYVVNADEMWITGNWFYKTAYGNFGDCRKATQNLPPDNFVSWKITQYEGCTRKSIQKVSISLWAQVYLVLTSQIQAT